MSGSSSSSSGGIIGGTSSSGGGSNGEVLTSAHVTWNSPEFRENGDQLSLSEIAGYEIIYRKTDESIFYSVIIDDDNTLEYTIENLSLGQYEFMIAVFDTDGLFSDYSEPALANL